MTFVVTSDVGETRVLKVDLSLSSDYENFAFEVADLLTDLDLDSCLFFSRSE